MSLVREKLRVEYVYSSEHLVLRQGEENENEPDEKDDECDDDDNEKKCRSSTSGTSSASSPTVTSIQLSAMSTNPSSSSFSAPRQSLVPPAPQPPSSPSPPSTFAASTFTVISSLAPQNPPILSIPVSTASLVMSPTGSWVTPFSTDQKSEPAASTSSVVAAAPATSRTPPPAQVNPNIDSAGKTAGIVLLIIAFFSFFATIFLYRRWRNRRRRRSNEKGKASIDAYAAEPPAPVPPSSRRDLPPLTSNPPMVSLPPPPPIQRTGQAPKQQPLSSNSSSYSDLAVLGTQPERPTANTRSTYQATQLVSNTLPRGPPREEKRHVAYGIPTFFQSAIDRRARNAEVVQYRGESWPPPPYTGKKELKKSSLRGPTEQSLRIPAPTLMSPRSLSDGRISSSETQESLVLPWRNSVESGISSLSSGWGDGPLIPAPVAITRKPIMGDTAFMSQARGVDVIQVTPREMV